MRETKNKTYKVFELGEPIVKDDWTEIEVVGLDEIYTKSNNPVSGAVGLLYAPDEYPGCCQMYYTWRSQPDEDGELKIEFYPAYTKDGDYILINTQKETPYVIFSNKTIISYNRDTMEPYKIGYLAFKTDGWNS